MPPNYAGLLSGFLEAAAEIQEECVLTNRQRWVGGGASTGSCRPPGCLFGEGQGVEVAFGAVSEL